MHFDAVASCSCIQEEKWNQTWSVMACRFGISLSCVVIGACSHATSLGVRHGSFADVTPHAEFTLNLQPPEENTHDVKASLDAIMKAENDKRILSDAAFAEAKQHLINVEKQQIQDIIREAFESTASPA